jgi:hypothetical protein
MGDFCIAGLKGLANSKFLLKFLYGLARHQSCLRLSRPFLRQKNSLTQGERISLRD